MNKQYFKDLTKYEFDLYCKLIVLKTHSLAQYARIHNLSYISIKKKIFEIKVKLNLLPSHNTNIVTKLGIYKKHLKNLTMSEYNLFFNTIECKNYTLKEYAKKYQLSYSYVRKITSKIKKKLHYL